MSIETVPSRARVSLMQQIKALIPRSSIPVLLMLVSASVVGCSLVAVRALLTRSFVFMFLPWNLVLAWVPLLLTLYFLRLYQTHEGWTPARLLIALLWLLFLPNAPYIVTDLVHLKLRHGYPMWADMIMIVLFAGTGFMLGFLSLFHIHEIVKARYGRLCGWIFALTTLVLTGLGVFIGRFLRWNSWDFFTNPLGLLSDLVSHFGNAGSNPGPLATTLLFATVCTLAYLTLYAVTHLRVSDFERIPAYEHREMDHAL